MLYLITNLQSGASGPLAQHNKITHLLGGVSLFVKREMLLVCFSTILQSISFTNSWI